MSKFDSRYRVLFGFLCALCILGGSIQTTFAQDSELRLAVRRIIGYGGGDQIEGMFRMELVEPPTLTSVTFYIDSVEVDTVTEPPFRVDFETGGYPLGWHELDATGLTPQGMTLTSDIRRFEFVSPEVGWQVAQDILVRVGGIVGLLIAIMLGIQIAIAFYGKRQTLPLGAPRKYGFKGGTICPKCHRPFSIHFLSFNLGPSNFDYCDHCGKWSLVKSLPREQLAAAEHDELDLAKPDEPIAEETPQSKLRRQLEDSKYRDEV